MGMRRPSLSLFDLNDDCIFHILLHLPLVDRLKFAYACDDFDDIIITFLKCNTLTVSDCCYNLSRKEAAAIFERFGLYVKRVNLDETVTSENVEIYKLIADNCPNIETIELHYPSRDEFEAYLSLIYRITSVAKQIQSFHVERKIFTDDWPNPWYYRVLEEKICEMISNLPDLRHLHLTHFYKATGKFLNKLNTLRHLNIEYCVHFKSEHFIQLCNAMKLKTLNIDNCTFLNDETLEALVETQTELETLTVSTEFDARNFRAIGRMKSLKQLVVYDYYGGRTLDGLLEEIVANHRDDFRILKIFTNAPHTVENHKVFQQRLQSLVNLQVLCLPYECLAENYVAAVGTKLTKLERLGFNVDESAPPSDKQRSGRIEILRLTRKLLPANTVFVLRLELVHRIIVARRNLNSRLLTIYLDIDNIAESVFESKLYMENTDVLRIEAVI